MDLALLKELKNQTQSLATNRRQSSDDSYQVGIQHLAKAQESGFEDKASLKEASKHFIKAIQFGRQNPEPYIAMAYLLILLGDQMTATRYLSEARRVDPQNADAEVLFTFLQSPEPVDEDEDDFELVALDGEAGDEDAQYEEAQRLIRSLLRQTQDLPKHPALNPGAFKQLEEQYLELEQKLQQIYGVLEELELEMDTTHLAQQVRPLEAALQQFAKLRRMSGRLIRVVQEMLQICEQLDADLGTLSLPGADAGQWNQNLEKYLDDCDRFADLLDEVDEQGFSISQLEPYYNQLVGKVEALQDVIDGL